MRMRCGIRIARRRSRQRLRPTPRRRRARLRRRPSAWHRCRISSSRSSAKLVERPPGRRRLGARDQVRRLPRAASRAERQGPDPHAHRARLDQSSSQPSPKPLKALPDCIIDGEICALDENNMPSFAKLQEALSEGKSDGLVFFAFDLLVEGKEDCPRAAPNHPQGSGLKALLEEADLGATRSATSNISKRPAMRCGSRPAR